MYVSVYSEYGEYIPGLVFKDKFVDPVPSGEKRRNRIEDIAKFWRAEMIILPAIDIKDGNASG